MRRWIVLLAAVLVVAGAACSQGKDAAGGRDTGVETNAPHVDLADAVAVAQRSMPVALPDSRVAILIEDLCAAGAGDADEVAAGLGGIAFADAAQLEGALASLEAGADDFCPDEVDPAVVEELRAAGPPPTSAPAAAAGSGSAGATSEAATGSSGAGNSASSGATSSASGSSSSPSGAANSSSGSASTGGGNATGTGNSSSTDFTQTVGSGSSGGSSSGDGASNAGSAGTP